jgi:hypothetical protein
MFVSIKIRLSVHVDPPMDSRDGLHIICDIGDDPDRLRAYRLLSKLQSTDGTLSIGYFLVAFSNMVGVKS